jgi:hypothetical protein
MLWVSIKLLIIFDQIDLPRGNRIRNKYNYA